MPVLKRIRRGIDKVKIGRALNKNRTSQGTQKVRKLKSEELERIATSRLESMARTADSLAKTYAEQRRVDQHDKNKPRGKGKGSPYKLTELGRTKEWLASLDREIERKMGHEAAEARALAHWLRKPESHRKAMEDWLKKHGRAEEWEKKRGQRK